MLTQAEKEELWHRGEYERIIEHDMPFIVWFVRKHTFYANDIADLIQDASLSCVKYIGHWRPNTCTFLTHFRYACRFALLHNSKKSLRKNVNDATMLEYLDSVKHERYTRGAEYLAEALCSLREVERDCFVAVHADGSYRLHGSGDRIASVSNKHGIGERSVYEISKRAIMKLRKYMKHRGA